jgi:hypothetical protein
MRIAPFIISYIVSLIDLLNGFVKGVFGILAFALIGGYWEGRVARVTNSADLMIMMGLSKGSGQTACGGP